MTFIPQVAGMSAKTLVDTGSVETLMTETFAKTLNLRLWEVPGNSDNTIVLPDGSSLPMKGTAQVMYQHDTYREQIAFKIVDLQIPFDVIGDNWLTSHKAVLQYVPASVKFWKNGRGYVLKGRKDDENMPHAAD